MKKLELLAPARNPDMGKTAVDYGADALYVGGPSFGARAAAGNGIEDIARLAEYARHFGVRVYAALNTLVFEYELPAAEKTARELIAAGVDALIVQDMAFMRMGLGGVEFHASTQMCNATAEHVRFLQEAGFSRVILERGLTLDEIKTIRAATTVDLECFVHGAVCVGFSGQCYLSRSMGPRSGNRGDCMQGCRLSYDLIDDAGQPVIRNKHLLSVQDLDFSARLGDLVDAGITSFKIEGRLKDEGYVKNIVAHYRTALDRLIAGRRGLERSSSGRSYYDFTPDPARSFTRGGSEWMLGGNRRGLASFDTPKATGAYMGEVVSTGRDSFRIAGGGRFTPGDGICFVADGELRGTNVNRADGDTVWPNRMGGITRGTGIYRNFDKAFEDALARSRTRRLTDARVDITVGAGFVTIVLADDVARARVLIDNTYGPAKDSSRMLETLRSEFSKSPADSVFRITDVGIVIEDGAGVPFFPVSVLADRKRWVHGALFQERLHVPRPMDIRHEDRAYPYPARTLGGEANVTNSLAERFYREHGVEHIEKAFDLRATLDGECVMTSAYCIRRELGECLRGNPRLRGELRLRRGTLTYRLDFDCAACRMRIIKE